MRIVLLGVLWAISVLMAPLSLHAGMTHEDWLAGEPLEEVIRKGDWDLVVATITSVSSHEPTNGNPPRVELTVHEILAGPERPRTLAAVWEPFPHDVDWEGTGSREAIETWSAKPMERPTAGVRMLLLGSGTPFRITAIGRHIWTAELQLKAVDALRARVADAEAARKKAEAEHADLEARRQAWRRAATPEAIARSAREADYVVVGRVVSGDATFQVDEVLKNGYIGLRMPFASVDLPSPALGLFDQRGPEAILFLVAHGAELESGGTAAKYPLVGVGIVIADREARASVGAAIRDVRGQVVRPLCLTAAAGYGSSLSAAENRALKRRLFEAFRDSAKGRCAVASTNFFMQVKPPMWAGDKLRGILPGARFAMLMSVADDASVSVAGVRLDPSGTRLVVEDEVWAAGAEWGAKARTVLNRLLLPGKR